MAASVEARIVELELIVHELCVTNRDLRRRVEGLESVLGTTVVESTKKYRDRMAHAFRELCAVHDWDYRDSDDPLVVRAGRQTYNRLLRVGNRLSAAQLIESMREAVEKPRMLALLERLVDQEGDNQ